MCDRSYLGGNRSRRCPECQARVERRRVRVDRASVAVAPELVDRLDAAARAATATRWALVGRILDKWRPTKLEIRRTLRRAQGRPRAIHR